MCVCVCSLCGHIVMLRSTMISVHIQHTPRHVTGEMTTFYSHNLHIVVCVAPKVSPAEGEACH